MKEHDKNKWNSERFYSRMRVRGLRMRIIETSWQMYHEMKHFTFGVWRMNLYHDYIYGKV
jgi:hypothetical protein